MLAQHQEPVGFLRLRLASITMVSATLSSVVATTRAVLGACAIVACMRGLGYPHVLCHACRPALSADPPVAGQPLQLMPVRFRTRRTAE